MAVKYEVPGTGDSDLDPPPNTLAAARTAEAGGGV